MKINSKYSLQDLYGGKGWPTPTTLFEKHGFVSMGLEMPRGYLPEDRKNCHPLCRAVEIEGEVFPSIAAATRKLGIGYKVIMLRVDSDHSRWARWKIHNPVPAHPMCE